MDDMMKNLNWTWIVTGFSIIGVVLNVKRKRICFWIWAGTNAAWAIVDYWQGIYSQAALFTVYFGLAIYGLVEWGRDR